MRRLREKIAFALLVVAFALPAGAHVPPVEIAPAIDLRAETSAQEPVQSLPVFIGTNAFDEVAHLELPLPSIADELAERFAAGDVESPSHLATFDRTVKRKLASGPLAAFEQNNVNEQNELGGETLWSLAYVRNRWYDPGTGTFLSPDPLGYRDSSNLYAFAAADPVNGRDPTGTIVAVYGSAAERAAALQRILRTIDNADAARHITVDSFNRLQVTGMTEEEFINRYSGRAQQLGRMIASYRTVFVTELRGELEHPISGASWPYPASLEEYVKRSGGGFFDPNYFGEGSGKGLVVIDPRRYPVETANVTQTADTVFVHEFFGHAYEWMMPSFLDRPKSYTGEINQRYVKKCDVCSGVGEGEAEGVAAENEYRLAHGLPVRTYYKSAKDDYIPPPWLAPHVKKQQERDAKKKKWWQVF